ncbi:DUF2971 domain-containing protein [Bradyrhizobium sp. 159]|uniref:DUF2971 domain-containing protein n=1 Tax=Bradyrhizobium sp. 159 TaxID=2782632 RepID=UPI001FF80BA5|nr:DUF2971 domain-containing protein [Bradyrhizobium sp. 159]MCK1620792.1 DUF2971 domain-containing protein [Bradyrhizobium sp. 159]
MTISASEANRIVSLYDPLHSDFAASARLSDAPPLLAHYTSVQVAEQIIKNEEIWFSHPFYMNDLEELRYGMNVGIQHLPSYVQAAAETPDRQRKLLDAFNHYIGHMNETTLVNTYVLCLSEHERADTDGVLSMGRSYASQGHGVALIFDGAKIPHQKPQAPLWIGKVKYCTPDGRVKLLQDKLADWARITAEQKLADDQLYLAAYGAFYFIKAFALITKHVGFREENEWRIIYVPELDPNGLLTSQFGYFVSPRGAEPKLKLKIAPVQNYDGTGFRLSLANLFHSALLGPSISSPLAKEAFRRLLRSTSLKEFEDQVHASTIPLRPTVG